MSKNVLRKRVSSKSLSRAHLGQIEVLKVLYQRNLEDSDGPLSVDQIVSCSKLTDDKEVRRHLLILEGQKLVSPFPEGDFTSEMWKITNDGARAAKTITKALV